MIDFGTAKDLIHPDLNGPEFVGTAEYMCPSVVAGKNTGCESDLWAIGVIFYQFLTGQTPFYAASPYLVFLRIKRCLIRYPYYVNESAHDLLNLLLEKDNKKRFCNAITGDINTNIAEIDSDVMDNKIITYDGLRNHQFFKIRSSSEIIVFNPIKVSSMDQHEISIDLSEGSLNNR